MGDAGVCEANGSLHYWRRRAERHLCRRRALLGLHHTRVQPGQYRLRRAAPACDPRGAGRVRHALGRTPEAEGEDRTHVAPYGVAPYYFFFAHGYAAEAIERLPEAERAAWRDRLHRLLMSVRDEDGTWNDRVFPRSASYGTAMAMLALTMPDEHRTLQLPATSVEQPSP